MILKAGASRFGVWWEPSSEKAMAPHSSTLAWKIPWTEEPGRLQSMGWWRVGHDWVTSLWLFTFRHWRRKWQPTPVFLPGESQGWGSLEGCCLWGRRVGHDWSDLAAAAAAAAESPLLGCWLLTSHCILVGQKESGRVLWGPFYKGTNPTFFLVEVWLTYTLYVSDTQHNDSIYAYIVQW